jgi:hypothetical protein
MNEPEADPVIEHLRRQVSDDDRDARPHEREVARNEQSTDRT